MIHTTDEERIQFDKWKKDGNKKLEGHQQAIWNGLKTSHFAGWLQVLKFFLSDLDFDRPFRITIDYDPEQPATVVRHYFNPDAEESRKELESYQY